jgi:hypothetical protein
MTSTGADTIPQRTYTRFIASASSGLCSVRTVNPVGEKFTSSSENLSR